MLRHRQWALQLQKLFLRELLSTCPALTDAVPRRQAPIAQQVLTKLLQELESSHLLPERQTRERHPSRGSRREYLLSIPAWLQARQAWPEQQVLLQPRRLALLVLRSTQPPQWRARALLARQVPMPPQRQPSAHGSWRGYLLWKVSFRPSQFTSRAELPPLGHAGSISSALKREDFVNITAD